MRDIPVEGIACFVALVLVALFSSILFRKLRFPCTIGLVIVGMLLYKLGGVFEPLHVLQRVHLTPNFILYILLPTLIFDAAINLDARELMRNIGPIFLLAAPGVLISTAVVGLAVEGAGLPQEVLEEMAPLEAALEAAGGWRGICAAVPRFKEFHPGTWDAVLAHVTAVRIGGEGAFHTGKGGPLVRIAERYGVSPVTLTRWRRRFPAALARVVLAGPVS